MVVTLSEVPQFPVRVVASSLPPIPTLARSVHWLRANRTLTLRLMLALVDVPTVREQVELVVPGPFAGVLVQPVQLET